MILPIIFSTCAWVRVRLPLLVGGDALGLDHRRVERHLIRCPSCRARLEALEATQHALSAAAAVDPVSPSVESLWPALSEQIRVNPRPRIRSAWALHPARRRLPLVWALPAAAIAAGVFITLGLIISRDYRSHQSTRNVVVRSQFKPKKSVRLMTDASLDKTVRPRDPRIVDQVSPDLERRRPAIPTNHSSTLTQ
jgi:anti-sigma factor RsiW